MATLNPHDQHDQHEQDEPLVLTVDARAVEESREDPRVRKLFDDAEALLQRLDREGRNL
jgi:hypothetical protein